MPAEIKPNLYHKKGAVAAARLPDQVNPERRSSGSQFYIVIGRKWTEKELEKIERANGIKFTDEQKRTYMNQGGTPFLDGQYTVFGEITKGIEVAEKIANLPRDRYDRPLEDVRFTVEIVGEKQKQKPKQNTNKKPQNTGNNPQQHNKKKSKQSNSQTEN